MFTHVASTWASDARRGNDVAANRRKKQRQSGTTAGAAPPAAGSLRPPDRPRGARWYGIIRRSEFGLCVAVTICVLACHFAFFQHRGGLWRDEVQIVNLGVSPTYADFWKDLAIDTFPALWPATVKCWSLVAGSPDGSLRILGLLVGLAIVGCVWIAAWQLGRGFPILALVLFALCPTVIRYGDTLRGYGLGLVFLLLMYAQVWKAASEPSVRHFVLGLITALLAVHAMYFNAVVLLALGAASAAIGLRRRTWRPVLAVAAIGLLAAVSLLPYADPLARQKRWHDIIGYDVSASFIAQKISESMNTAGAFAVWVWLGVAVLAVAAAIYTAVRMAFGRGNGRYDAGLYAGSVIIAGSAGYAAFIFATRQPTNIWYYMPLMAFLAVSFDAVFESRALAHPIARAVRLAGAVRAAGANCAEGLERMPRPHDQR